MAVIGDRLRNSRATALLSFGLLVNMAPIGTFAAVLPEIGTAWGLSAAAAGWIGGIYFAGYAAAVPFLTGLTDRIDGRWIFAGSSLLGAVASLVFGIYAHGLAAALVLRFLGGAALAGVHMPGLKLLAERTTGRNRARGSAVYASFYTLGAAGSFFIAGAVDTNWGWRGAFAASGIVPLCAIAGVLLLPPRSETAPDARFTLDLRPLLQNRELMAYVTAFAGNIWEVSAIRAWFVAYLAWVLALPHNGLPVPRPAVLAGLASIAGFAASIAVAECALRCGPRAIVATAIASVAILLALAATAGGAAIVVLPLLMAAQVASLADASALAGGAVVAADPARRGAALAVFAFVGYVAAFVGPVAAGITLDLFGGADHPIAWRAAFATMALGSAVAALAMRRSQPTPVLKAAVPRPPGR